MTCEDTAKSTCLPESAAGPLPYSGAGGHQTDLFGAPVALARLSALPGNQRIVRDAKAKCLSGILEELELPFASSATTGGRPTPATYGLRSGVLSANADLQQSLESKLRDHPDLIGGPLYGVAWHSSDTLLGPPVCRLRPLPHRTVVNVSSGQLILEGWHTPDALVRQGSLTTNPDDPINRKMGGNMIPLDSEVLLTEWPTPITPGDGERNLDTATIKNGVFYSPSGKRTQLHLEYAVKLIQPWPTPKATDGNKAARTPEGAEREVARAGANNELGTTVHLTGWATPVARDHKDSGAFTIKQEKGKLPHQVHLIGVNLPSSSAAMTERGQLNPAFSRWLMGFPPEWDACAPTETP